MAAAVEGIVKNVFSCLGPDLEKKTNVLQRKVDLLGSRKDDVLVELGDEAYLHGKKRKREVGDWLINVENITSEFETLRGEVVCSRVYKRQTLTEQVEIMTEEVTELLEQSDFPKGLFLDVDTSDYLNSAVIVPLWESIEDDNVNRIGICSLEEALKKLREAVFNYEFRNKSTSLGHVYQVRVSQKSSTYKLQSDVAHALDLDLSRVNDERIRATILHKAFKKKGRSLLILDDVWEQIDTEKIGIPLGMKECKLIITSRSEEVCQQMQCQRIIQVNKASEQEACELLLKKLSSVQLQQ